MAKVRYRCPEGGINSPGDASQDAMHTPSESKSNAERNSKTCDSELQWFEFKKQQGESSAPVGAVQKELAAAQPAGTSRAFGNSQARLAVCHRHKAFVQFGILAYGPASLPSFRDVLRCCGAGRTDMGRSGWSTHT
mmetsp:Transcript_14260/g.27829  ORF Transcript_14260/g.27829 Transcript_14260/m.27829 type:complete len:136 (+) Transcript_14260:747-1154(+)|eukprot:3276265-Pleurochrysis_carterae.AAC.2